MRCINSYLSGSLPNRLRIKRTKTRPSSRGPCCVRTFFCRLDCLPQSSLPHKPCSRQKIYSPLTHHAASHATISTPHAVPSAMTTSLNNQLAFSAFTGDHTQLALLLAQGADPCLTNSQPLALAAHNGHAECVKLLVPVSDPKTRNSEALRRSAENGHAECVRLLIPVSDPKTNDSAPLFSAAAEGHAECVRLLIPASNPKARDSYALCLAASNGHLECIRLLIPESDPLLHHQQALTSALESGCPKTLSLMLASEPLFLTGVDLSHCLADAIANGHSDLAGLLSSIIETASIADLISLSTSFSSSPQRL